MLVNDWLVDWFASHGWVWPYGRLIDWLYYCGLDLLFFRYAFFEFSDPKYAKAMIQTLNGHKFDKQHTWTVDLFTDFDKYANYPDEWEEPGVRPYKEHVRACNLRIKISCFYSLVQYCIVICEFFVREGKLTFLVGIGRLCWSILADFWTAIGMRAGCGLFQHAGWAIHDGASWGIMWRSKSLNKCARFLFFCEISYEEPVCIGSLKMFVILVSDRLIDWFVHPLDFFSSDNIQWYNGMALLILLLR